MLTTLKIVGKVLVSILMVACCIVSPLTSYLSLQTVMTIWFNDKD